MKRLFILLTLTLLLPFGLWAQQDEDAPVINIIHTNDTHSQIEPTRNRQHPELHGGVVERAAMLEYYRKQDPELLYLDAGDMVQGSPYFNVFRGEVEVLCMNQQGLLAMTLGNHEFDNGVEGIKAMMRIADFPIVCSNYHCEGTAIEHYVVPHLITVSHGVRIGITGVTCDPAGLIAARNYEGIIYEDPALAIAREERLLREEGCDLVIVLSHVGYMAAPMNERDSHLDTYLASLTHDVDLIIGAHTHVNIERGVRVNNADGRPVLITQTGGKASPIGHLQVMMRKGSPYPGCHYSVDSIVCHKLHPEEHDLTGLGQGLEELIAPYRETLDREMNTTLATAPEALTKGHPQSSLGNFTTDAMRQVCAELTGRKVEVAVTNLGGLRGEIMAGPVTTGTIYSIFPFDNNLVLLDLKGSDLQQLIESNAGRKLDCWSGTQITLTMDGDRCKATRILVDGQPIDPERIYTLCTIDYLAEGNSGMTPLTNAVATSQTGVTIRDAMIDYVTRLGKQGLPVRGEKDDRVMTDF